MSATDAQKTRLVELIPIHKTLLENVTTEVKVLQQYEIESGEIELRTRSDVASEKGVDNKPRFSNETLRDAETQRRLSANQAWMQKREMIRTHRDSLSEYEAAIEQVKFELKVYDIITR